MTTPSRIWVVKIGSSLLTNDGRGLDRDAIAQWSQQLARLREQNIHCVLVSSGSVAEGLVRLGWSSRPTELERLQAAAAVGQMGLVEAWENALGEHGLRTAQILLTHEDMASRRRYLNARSTLRTLVGLGVVPVVNENDTVAMDELRLGDNDTLAGMVTNLLEAEQLVILTDQDGLFDADPRSNPDAELVPIADANDPALFILVGDGAGTLGRGGMRTKVFAAQRAANSGADTVIASGRETDVLLKIAAKEDRVGTRLTSSKPRLAARKQWIAGLLQVRGKVKLDRGASQVLEAGDASLLPVGVVAVEGQFGRGDVISCLAADGQEIARGLANYSAEEAKRIAGKPSGEIEAVLGYSVSAELIHRDDMVLMSSS